jgi:hypothetical protein
VSVSAVNDGDFVKVINGMEVCHISDSKFPVPFPADALGAEPGTENRIDVADGPFCVLRTKNHPNGGPSIISSLLKSQSRGVIWQDIRGIRRLC